MVLGSLRQLFRTPVKTVFFFVLLTLTVAFFMLGFNMWSIAQSNISRLEGIFMTVGTVEQKATSLRTSQTWDAEKKKYFYNKYSVQGEPIPLSVLDFPGANYIRGPEQRPFYCAYDPSYIVLTDISVKGALDEDFIIAEIQFFEDCETGDPVPARITKLLMGIPTLQDTMFLFCNHNEEKTYKLYADKTYIVGLWNGIPHEGNEAYNEFIPWNVNYYEPGGDSVPWDEVTEGFYDTPKGKAWLNFIFEQKEAVRHTIPVVPTNYTKLIMPFYMGDARIIEGRDITDEEYANGEHVCLIQRGFAQKNGLSVGDTLPLPLVSSGYYSSKGAFYDGETGTSGDLIGDSEGLFPPFDNDTYSIVGIYDVAATSANTSYALGGNAVIIPSKSVTNTDPNIYPDSMMDYSTTFQIPNGTIDKFMASWKAQSVDDIEITLYDKGYSKIMAGLSEMRNIAALMFIVGAVTTLFTIVLFCHLFITKQRRRTAIERSLGLSKARCTLSMLVGVLVIVIPAFIIGGLLSSTVTAAAAPQINSSQSVMAFDTRYSDWVNSADYDSSADMAISLEGGGTAYLLGAAIIPLSLLFALWAVRGNLKEEPLKLLGEKER